MNKITIDWTDDLKEAFKLDFPEANPSSLEALDKFSKNPKLVESWKSFKNAGLDDLAKNTDNLDALNKALKQGDYDAVYFENLLKTKSDPQKFIDDYVKKLGDDGKFLDAATEADYASYLGRKTREGKHQKIEQIGIRPVIT